MGGRHCRRPPRSVWARTASRLVDLQVALKLPILAPDANIPPLDLTNGDIPCPQPHEVNASANCRLGGVLFDCRQQDIGQAQHSSVALKAGVYKFLSHGILLGLGRGPCLESAYAGLYPWGPAHDGSLE